MEAGLEAAHRAEIDREEVEEQRALGLGRGEMSLPRAVGFTFP